MCDSVLSSLLEQGFKDLRSFCWKLIRFGKNVKEFDSTMSEFKLYLQGFHQVLGDTNTRDICPEMHKWLEKVEGLAYDIEGILDVVDHETQQRQHAKFSRTSVLPIPLKLCYKLSDEVKATMIKIEEVNKEKELRRNELSEHHYVPIRSPEGPTPIDRELFGRETERAMMIDFLLRPDDGDQRYGIIPIVGMGGVGKTTLAQHVYNDKRVVSSFEVRAWACASMDFDACKAFKSIIEQLTGSCNVQEPSSIKSMLHTKLKDKKVLIILDDLWEEKILEWRQFLGPFVDAAPGSKVIVTTRDSAIANRIRTAERVINLSLLSDDDCWSLFSRYAGLETKTCSQSQLVTIGNEISKKCGGLPLAAIVIGSLLRGKDSEEQWRAVLNDESWKSNEITDVLKLSYDNLPYCLKCCFAFCTIFPEDHEFDGGKLVTLWLLAGVIECREQGRTYLDELVSRCLLLQKQNDLISRYVMHDLIRDMGQQVCCSRYKYYELDKTRHLLIDSVAKGKKALRLRTLRVAPMTCDIIPNEDVDTLLLKFTKLRVLWLENLNIASISKPLREMRHLRYLCLNGCKQLKEIPSDIGRLGNLSELHICDCTALTLLASEIGRLSNLIELKIESCPGLTQLPADIGDLSSLVYLNIWDCPELTQLPQEIGSLSSLIMLTIYCLGLTQLPLEIGNLSKLGFFEIVECPRLTELPSEIGRLGSLEHFLIECSLTELPSEIGRLCRLKQLEICDCVMLTQLPSEIGSLSNLSKLIIDYCPRLTLLPSEIGRLSRLEKLEIRNCETLTQLPSEIGSLSNLSELTIENCPGLTLLPSEISSLSNLSQLNIKECPGLTILPEIENLSRLQRD